MQGAVVSAIGGSVDIFRDVSTVGPKFGEVKVAIKATGVCHTDYTAWRQGLGGPLPFVLGHEASGIVTDIGDGVTRVSVGDRVVLTFVPACGNCRRCLAGQVSLCLLGPATRECARFERGGEAIYGLLGTGTFAEEVVVVQESVVPIAHDVPFDIAALIGCAATTGIGAVMHSAQVRPGSTVAVIGCGAVGLNVIQAARLVGAGAVVAIDLHERKLELALSFGATHACQADDLDSLCALVTANDGFDHAFEASGARGAIRRGWDLVRRGGTLTIVGLGEEDERVTFAAPELLRQAKTIKGTIYGSGDARSDFPLILDLWRAGRLDLESLIDHRISLKDIGDAFRSMEQGTALRHVIVFD